MTVMDQLTKWPLLVAVIPTASAALCAALIVVLHPLLVRYALARPNARSSHTEPTPQGAGIAIVTATISIILLANLFCGQLSPRQDVNIALAAAAFLALVGATDDLRPIAVLPRLALQIAAAAAVLAVLPASMRIAPFIPFWMERGLILVAILWFVNLTNFMDGLDWMTIAEMLPITAALSAFGLMGAVPSDILPLVLALGGALVGFAPFNRPVAKLFMGDVGSLPIGLLIAWCLVLLAGEGHRVAALLLPLYYLADATITLVRRFMNGEKVWIAHRTHFYQRATDNGYTVIQVARNVFVLNILLATLATASIVTASALADTLLLGAGIAAVAVTLVRFSRRRVRSI